MVVDLERVFLEEQLVVVEIECAVAQMVALVLLEEQLVVAEMERAVAQMVALVLLEEQKPTEQIPTQHTSEKGMVVG